MDPIISASIVVGLVAGALAWAIATLLIGECRRSTCATIRRAARRVRSSGRRV